MYQDKLAQLKRQVQQLKDGTLPIYMKKMKKLEQQYKERLRLNSLWVKRELEVVQEEYKSEKELANKEFEVRIKVLLCVSVETAVICWIICLLRLLTLYNAVQWHMQEVNK